MKLPITDQFLWEMYRYIETAGNVTDFIFSSPYKKANIIRGDQNPIIGKYRKDMGRKEFSRFVYYLKKRNYIKVKNLKNSSAFIITKNGISKALKASFSIEKRAKREDGKWIMLMFDVPQTHRKARNLLKSILRNLGYKMFQQSVWISPYDVSEKTEKLLQLYDLDNYVKIFLIEKT